jgi:RNA polymerase sigma-70 factor (ECF subfamily)
MEHGMSKPEQDFGELLRRAREGDGAAAAELVRQYEPEIRRAIRLRMTDPRLRRVIDSMDVCQSVLANFFVRVSAGQYDLQRSEDLVALLVAMVRNKVVDQARRLQADKRDQRRVELTGDSVLARVASLAATPDQLAANRDLLDEVRRRLDDDERHLADQRALGREWADIAAELNVNADAIRKKLTRALNRVSAELGLDGAHDE